MTLPRKIQWLSDDDGNRPSEDMEADFGGARSSRFTTCVYYRT